MNRRVLLVDADPAFQGTLTKQLGRYRVVLMTEHEPDRALQLAQADLPDLVVIGVEEPEKLGFKTFQKLRKALPAKVPIMLVTSTVAPEAFAKHKTMKVHANEYMDKRGLSTDELIAKIDNLIGLGDLQEDDISVPVDDMPMEIGDGDVVLDEQLDDDSVGSFEHEMQTVGPNSGVKMSDIVEAETDAAFAALLGGDDEPAPPKRAGLPGVAPHAEPAIAEPVHAEPDEPPHRDSIPEIIGDDDAHDSGVPEPVPHKIPDDEPDEEPISQKQWDADSIPAVVHDGGRPSSTYDAVPHDDFDAEEHVHVGAAPDAPEAVAEDAAPEPILHAESDREPLRREPSAPIEREPSAPIAAAVEKEPSAPIAAADVASDVAEEQFGGDSLAAIPVMDDELISLDDELPIEEEDEPAAAPVAAATVDAEATVAREPIVPEAALRPEKKTGKAVDLGLDQIAESADAERDQSGVYDRKALRKIGDLEHQISQLKTELERARAQVDANATGGSRESQFLKLREDKLAKEKELKDAKKAVETQAKELAEATEKLRQATHSKEQLEAKNAQLEERLLEDSGKAKDFGAKVQTLTAQVHQLEADLDSKSRAANTAETALAQTEKDLATERAGRAASASEAERTLRVDQERTIARHKGELAALRAELETVQDQSLGRQKEELEVAHAAKIDEALEELRAANMAEHTEAIETLENKHNKELVSLKADHAGEVTRHKNELGGRVAELEAAVTEAHAAHAEAHAGHEAALAEAHAAHAEALAEAHAAHAEARAGHEAALAEANAAHAEAHASHEATLAETKSSHEAAVAELKSDHKAALAAARSGHATLVATAMAEHQSALEQMRQAHDATLDSLRDEHAEALERHSESHGQALATLKSQLDHATAAHEVKLAAARKEAEDAAAQAALDKALLFERHETALAEMQEQHNAAFTEHQEKNEAERAQLADAAKRAADSHQAGLADLKQKHDEQLADAQATAQREIAEARAHSNATKKAADDAAAKAAAEREELQQAHASTIGELEAKHERAIAVANGEALKAKAVADAERQKAEQALRAEHERARQQLESTHAVAIGDLSGERDELQKGLSGARESLKRSEGELASAVQTIADRNADIRAHQAAISERDQRIADLRKEIEGLEQENANYQDQVLRAYQKIKSDEAMVARARKAMAIALTVLDDQGNPTDKPSS